MKNPTTLFTCVTRHDACFLKNVIQRVTFLGVEMVRVEGVFQLYVDKCNYNKARIILATQLDYLPSVVAEKAAAKEREMEGQLDMVEQPTYFAKLFTKLDDLLVSTIHVNLTNH
ncbi:hypothetical protein [Wenyingzhuangia sp. IMCC45574]